MEFSLASFVEPGCLRFLFPNYLILVLLSSFALLKTFSNRFELKEHDLAAARPRTQNKLMIEHDLALR
jgi:hypothetical protein